MERTVCLGRANAACRGERCKIRFLRPFVGADDSVRPSKFVDFSWIFVGADAHLGAKSRALRGCASKLACGRRIGPLKCCRFASDFRKNRHFRRADRVVRPYGAKSKLCTITLIRPYGGVSVSAAEWVDVGIDPYGMESEIPPHVGADAHIGPPRRRTENAAVFRLTRLVFNTICRGGRLCPPSKSGDFFTAPAAPVGAAFHFA